MTCAGRFVCERCGLAFEFPGQLDDHRRVSHPALDGVDAVPPPPELRALFACDPERDLARDLGGLLEDAA